MLEFFKSLFLPPKLPKRKVDNIVLYYYPGCPYCRLVMKQIKILNLEIEHRNIHQNEQWKQELTKYGGKKTVPCLRIEAPDKNAHWMYESLDIAAFLRKEFS